MDEFNIDNFTIDRTLRGIMISEEDGSVMYSINQIEDPVLNVSTNEVSAVDALGATIATYQNAKNCEFSASNSLFDLNLFSAQMGVEKKYATVQEKMTVPCFETIEVFPGDTTVALSNTPKNVITEIYGLHGDNTLSEKYTLYNSGKRNDSNFSISGSTITLPNKITELSANSKIFVTYDYETENAVSVSCTSVDFPKNGKFILEVLGNDVCDPSVLIYAYIVFPHAKLTSSVDLTFTTNGKHPFTLKCQQDYCDEQKGLFEIVVPYIDPDEIDPEIPENAFLLSNGKPLYLSDGSIFVCA